MSSTLQSGEVMEFADIGKCKLCHQIKIGKEDGFDRDNYHGDNWYCQKCYTKYPNDNY